MAEKWFAFRHVSVTLAAYRAVLAGPPGRLVVFDEGVCQRAFLILVDAAGTARPRQLERFIRAAPRSDVVVALRVEPQLALQRLRGRGHGGLSYRFAGLSEDQLLERLAEGQRLLLRAVDLLGAHHPDTTCILIDADRLPRAMAELERQLSTALVDLPPAAGHLG